MSTLLAVTPVAFAQQGWSGTVTTLASGDALTSRSLEAVVDPAGNVTALWVAGGVWASRQAPDRDAWSAAVQVSQASADLLDAVVDPAGNVFAAWIAGASVVQAARFDAQAGAWAPPATLASTDAPSEERYFLRLVADSAGSVTLVWNDQTRIRAVRHVGGGAWAPVENLHSAVTDNGHLVVDAAGNVTAAWVTDDTVVQAARFDVLRNQWSSVVTLSAQANVTRAGLWGMVVDPAGQVTVTWSVDDARDGYLSPWIVGAASYTPALDAWQTASHLGRVEAFYPGILAVDEVGTVTMAWVRPALDPSNGEVVALRCSPATIQCTGPVVLSAPRSIVSLVDVLIGPDTTTTVVWNAFGFGGWWVQAARHLPGSNEWGPAADVVQVGGFRGPGSAAAIDTGGNIFIHSNPERQGLSVVRYSAAAARLAGPDWVSQAFYHEYPARRLVVDSFGRATAVWTRCRVEYRPPHPVPVCVDLVLETTTWVATPAAPVLRSGTPGSGTLTIGFEAPLTPDPAFAPTTYEYSLDDGLTWTPRAPASTVTPLRIGELVNGVSYPVRLRARNAAGPGLASAAIGGTPLPAPNAPTNLAVLAQAGHTVTLGWVAASGGLPPTGYAVEGGRQPDEVVTSLATGSTAPTYTFVAPPGAYYLRVHAVAGEAWSAPSNEIRIVVNVHEPPSAPANLLGLVNGSSLTLSWTNTFGGGAPTALWLDVSGAITTTLPLPMGETFSYANAPPGTYTLRLRASNASGPSPPSNGVTLTFPDTCSGVPGVPTNFQAWRVGSAIHVSWSPPPSGPAVTSYTVIVGGAYVGSFTTTARAMSGAAAPGGYSISVAANNVCGTGPPSPTEVVVVP